MFDVQYVHMLAVQYCSAFVLSYLFYVLSHLASLAEFSLAGSILHLSSLWMNQIDSMQ